MVCIQAEDAAGAVVPGHQVAGAIHQHHPIRQRRDQGPVERLALAQRFAQGVLRRHVAKHQHHPLQNTVVVADRRGVVGDLAFLAVAAGERDVVAQFDLLAALQDLGDRIGDRLAGSGVGQLEDLAHRLADRLSRRPAGEPFRDRIHLLHLPAGIGDDDRIAERTQGDGQMLFARPRLLDGRPQLLAHPVEGGHQLTEFALTAPLNIPIVEIVDLDAAGGGGQIPQRLDHLSPQQPHQGQRDQQDGAGEHQTFPQQHRPQRRLVGAEVILQKQRALMQRPQFARLRRQRQRIVGVNMPAIAVGQDERLAAFADLLKQGGVEMRHRRRGLAFPRQLGRQRHLADIVDHRQGFDGRLNRQPGQNLFGAAPIPARHVASQRRLQASHVGANPFQSLAQHLFVPGVVAVRRQAAPQ